MTAHDTRTAPGTTDRGTTTRLCALWSLWNGDLDLAALVRRHRRAREGLTFAPHGAPIVDVDGQRAALVWTATIPDPQGGPARVVSGIDAFDVEDGRFTRCRSVTGGRVVGF